MEKLEVLDKVKFGSDNNIVEITLYEELPAGKNTIKIDGVQDATYLKILCYLYEKEIDTKDTTKPTCSGIATSDKKENYNLQL